MYRQFAPDASRLIVSSPSNRFSSPNSPSMVLCMRDANVFPVMTNCLSGELHTYMIHAMSDATVFPERTAPSQTVIHPRVFIDAIAFFDSGFSFPMIERSLIIGWLRLFFGFLRLRGERRCWNRGGVVLDLYFHAVD